MIPTDPLELAEGIRLSQLPDGYKAVRFEDMGINQTFITAPFVEDTGDRPYHVFIKWRNEYQEEGVVVDNAMCIGDGRLISMKRDMSVVRVE